MDGQRFDRVAVALGAGTDRRWVLGGLLGGALAAALGGGEGGARRRRRRRCRSCPGGRVCRRNRCRPCRSNAECARQYGGSIGSCIGGRCEECESGDPFNGDFLCDELTAGAFPYCVGNACVECRARADCPANHACSASGACVDRQGTCPAGGDNCAAPGDAVQDCNGNEDCACYQTLGGETVCADTILGTCHCAGDAECEAHPRGGPGAACVRFASPCNCTNAGDPRGLGHTICARPCPPQA